MGLAHAGNSKRRVKYTFCFLRKTYVVDVECTRCTQPVQKIKDIKNIRTRPHVSTPARADAFLGSLKKASIFVELVFRLQI